MALKSQASADSASCSTVEVEGEAAEYHPFQELFNL